MELRQELKTHAVNMQSSLRLVKDFRPQWWITLLLVGFAFVVGMASGLHIEAREGYYRWQSVAASWQSGAIAEEAKGNLVFPARMRQRALDNAVTAYADRMQLPAWKREGTDLIYRVILHVPSRPDVELRMVRTIAERRLTLLPAQAATIDKVNRIGFTTANAWSLTMYEKVAAAYSQVLGRTVSPAQLLTETDLQVQLQIEAQRKAALQVDAQK